MLFWAFFVFFGPPKKLKKNLKFLKIALGTPFFGSSFSNVFFDDFCSHFGGLRTLKIVLPCRREHDFHKISVCDFDTVLGPFLHHFWCHFGAPAAPDLFFWGLKKNTHFWLFFFTSFLRFWWILRVSFRVISRVFRFFEGSRFAWCNVRPSKHFSGPPRATFGLFLGYFGTVSYLVIYDVSSSDLIIFVKISREMLQKLDSLWRKNDD